MLHLDTMLLYVREFVATLGVVIITYGATRAAINLVRFVLGRDVTVNYVRVQFGTAIILGLEFVVAADIVGSMVKPDYYDIGLLAILVIIRTFLSYFLTLELAQLTPQEKIDLRKS